MCKMVDFSTSTVLRNSDVECRDGVLLAPRTGSHLRRLRRNISGVMKRIMLSGGVT
jgi:hypothetical protein